MTLNMLALDTAPEYALRIALRDYYKGLAPTILRGIHPRRNLDHWAGPILDAIRRIKAELDRRA